MPQNQARWDSALANQKILFVSGKGGVGKSLIAAGIARQQAAFGRRVLLVEIGDTSYYQDFFGLSSIGHVPGPTALGFDIALWSGETCLREYVLHFLKLERVFKIFFENRVMRALINVAPGLNEISILGKVTSGIRKVGPPLDYDLIVVDCYATGHALALFQAPKGLQEAIGFGPMGTQSREIEAVLQNSKLCGYAVVTLLEEMPVTETLEFRKAMQKELGVAPAIIANKVLRAPVSRQDLEKLANTAAQGLGEFAKYLVGSTSRQEEFLALLRREFPQTAEVPLTLSNDAEELVRTAGEALRQA